MITNNYILILTGMLLLFLIILFTVTVISKSKKQNQPQPEPKQPHQHIHQPKSKAKERHEEVVDTLNWMLQYNIIDTNEYNKLMVKSLPYLN